MKIRHPLPRPLRAMASFTWLGRVRKLLRRFRRRPVLLPAPDRRCERGIERDYMNSLKRGRL
jgi:hypothetical protein